MSIEELINAAIKHNATIEIYYSNASNVRGRRILSDLHYESENNQSMLSAYCHRRNERRTFLISRISTVRVLEPENFYEMMGIEPPIYEFNSSKRIFSLYGEKHNFNIIHLSDNDNLDKIES